MLKILAFAVLACTVSACGVREHNVRMFDDQRQASAAERAVMAKVIREEFFDPYTVRDAEISSVITSMGLNNATTRNVCVKANAKNRMGAYTGRQNTMYTLAPDNSVINTAKDTFLCLDGRVRYERFTEIEMIAEKGR